MTVSYNFTLAAYNITLPNSDRNGAALVLGQNGTERSNQRNSNFLQTRASYPYNDYPTLALISGSLRAYRTDGSWNTNATEVRSGSTLGWITTTRYARPAPEIYSAVNVPLTKFPLLAAHGRHDLWSLCPFPGRLGQTNVVFNVSAVASSSSGPSVGFDPKGCYEVVLFIIGV
ncbi:hypothetical protein P691DRAFT_666554 [Macrolepiota fuliginosa MF-IS2]|uniref:Uncharacterized protein n=1 Tax=Macrolepiota fuliginosa MF-IS2 TaxID=1400762 RepID=A0A9P5XHG3_9AGAR|nr:hypothetical protein P691DRAFT_666554 [Macrolepiota fuliginosa MF-IS2]